MPERMTKEQLLKFKQWDAEETCQYLKETCQYLKETCLQENKLGTWETKCKENEITGDKLQDLTVEKLVKMGISKPECLQILNALKKLWQIQSKVFNDPIHGTVELHPLLVKIIDTPQFQRLRYLKQLGGGYYVYPGASHNRFEHSIGVAHLAGELAHALQTRQPDLEITDRDILCVQIAGLCHDLGHGPFSHLYDGIVIPETEKKGWKHEDGSVDMFDHLVKENELKRVMVEHGLMPDAKAENDLIFIKEMFKGPLNTQTAEGEWQYQGRTEEKSFLYEIVANKRTGIDVDKFDYFARDCHHLGIRNNFDHQRFIKFARVCEVAGKKHICTRDKEEYNMYEMFHTRLSLHKRAYQHKTTKIIEHMIAEAFLKADKHIKIKGSKGKIFTLSTAIDDMEAYTKLTDHVFEQILNPISVELKETKDPVQLKEPVEPKELQEARGILQRIVSRNFYKFLGEWTMAEKPKEVMKTTWRDELARALKLEPEDIIVSATTLDYGMKDKNPIDNLHFYSKYDHTIVDKSKKEVSKLLPTCFSETMIRVYSKKTDIHKEHFTQWCIEKGFKNPQDEN